jgi:hypothetical protein
LQAAETEGNVFEKLRDGLVLPYWGFSELTGRPLFYWDQEDEELRNAQIHLLNDENPPRLACFFGTVTDYFPDQYRQWIEMQTELQPWPICWFGWPFYNLLGVPVVWALHSGVNCRWYRTYDELKASWPDAHDPKWREIED